MKVLFIGGTGIISSASSRLCVARGIELYHLRRGRTSRPVPEEIRLLSVDIRDAASVRRALGDHHFDAVVDWIAFTVMPFGWPASFSSAFALTGS